MSEFSWPVRVYYEDTDAGGIVYYANYLKFCERARTEWLRELGVEQDGWLGEGTAFVVRHVDMDLKAPARFNDLLSVRTLVTDVKRASVRFEQQIFNQHEQLLCSAHVKAACVNIHLMKPVAIPAAIAEVIKRGT
ncbi:tol-pal system-associated acyl-CoA thioesterase [Aliidiomarina sedimenti]|uniref:Tol-pal system-associated acyl-CoA thioesterase n=2 Tax=Aliidiomarina TaxID=1249554 RepID=A0A432WD05_9GAMM|nr:MULTISPECIES: tol-pal system-associated acyl-CoA thioesterase [Aliidiomarina]RUO29943.1 tol-pal system-associated acyl-CoA thioesterase [Aliidiomarina sedimenti]RUO30283.1 tol-pal system-associated acyl-CoA thioesterase [Aliidiomarina soli]